LAFLTALQRAYDAADHDLLARLKSQLAHAAPLLTASGQPVTTLSESE
jgi:hypothetical protein